MNSTNKRITKDQQYPAIQQNAFTSVQQVCDPESFLKSCRKHAFGFKKTIQIIKPLQCTTAFFEKKRNDESGTDSPGGSGAFQIQGLLSLPSRLTFLLLFDLSFDCCIFTYLSLFVWCLLYVVVCFFVSL